MKLDTKLSSIMLDTYRRAARLHASVNRADPFAYGRALCHMVNGIMQAGEVIADAKARGGVAQLREAA
jgi:hypothetical protein